MKRTLQAICKNRYVKEETRIISFTFLNYLPEVDTPTLTKEIFTSIYFTRHNVHYRRMIHLAQLLYDLTLLSHKQGNWSLFSARLDETSLNSIFEKFLLNFYRIEQHEYRVFSKVIQWKLDRDRTLLPYMKTDISLLHKNGK